MKRDHLVYLSAGIVLGFALGFAIAWGLGRSPASVAPSRAASMPPPAAAAAGPGAQGRDPLMEQMFETIQELQDRVDENPHDAEALLELAGMYLEISRLDEARTYLERLLEVEPGHRQGLTQLGLVLAESGDLDGARARFRATVEADPDYWEGWFYLAVTEIRRGDLEAAAGAADRVEALEPGLPELADLRNHLTEHRSREER